MAQVRGIRVDVVGDGKGGREVLMEWAANPKEDSLYFMLGEKDLADIIAMLREALLELQRLRGT